MSTCQSCAYLDDTGHCVELEEHILQTTGVHVDTPKINRSRIDDQHNCPCFERSMADNERLRAAIKRLIDPYCTGKKPGDTVDEQKWRK